MSKARPEVLVVGAGSIGGVTAAFMARAGHDPVLVCKHREIAERAASPGLHVFGWRGDFRASTRAVARLDELSGVFDLVFLATKAADALPAAKELLPFLHPQSLVISLQNGIAETALARELGRERVVGCVVGWGATMHGPAELEMTSPGEFVIGNLDQREDDRLPMVRELLETTAPTRISRNIMGELYSKLIINSCINSLGVITGMTLGPMLARRKVRNIFIAQMREAMAVARALGIKVEPGGGGKLHYDRFMAQKGFWADGKRHLMIRLIGMKYRNIKSSSLQSIERGRLSEVDFLNGYICDRGAEKGVPTPVNDRVRAMVKEIESGQRKMKLANVDDPLLAGQ